MSCASSRAAAIIAVCLVVLGGSVARSARASEREADAYEAPPECPGPSAFDAEVGKRVSSQRALPRARISITKSAQGYDGRMILDGLARDVRAATCAELVQALALAVAMASEEETEEAAASPAPARSAPSASAESVGPEAPPVKAPVGPEKRTEWVLGLGFGATSAVGLGISPELSILGGLDVDGRSLRIGASATRSGTLSNALGTARFERWALNVNGCPVTVRPVPFLRLSPCARFDAGVLRGLGESLANAESTPLLWLALSAGGRMGFDISRAIFVEGEARAVLPLLRHGFFVRPNDVVYRVPVMAAEVSLSVGYRFSK